MALQHLRSSTAHKRPIPTVMSAGQIAVNTNEASPGLFFKDSNGDLVKVGPVHIGPTAPNSSPASVAATALVTGTVYQILTVGTSDFTLVGASSNTVGTIFTATGTTTGTGTVSGQQGVEKGEQWLDTTGGTYVLKIYDGTDWRSESGTFVDVSGDTMTGALLLDNAASASAPDLSFDGDANTGIYSPGADQVAISTSGTGRLFIDSSGNVGIGTSSPENYGSGFVTVEARGTSADGGGVFQTRSYDASVKSYYYCDSSTDTARIGTITNHPFLFVTNTTERMRIDSSGLVGIGTSSPNAKTEISGQSNDINLRLTGNSSTAVYLDFFQPGTAQWGLINPASADRFSIIKDGSSGTEYLTINNTGRVGIGTTSPAYALTVKTSNDNGIALTRPTDASATHLLISTTETGADAYTVNYNTSNNDQIFSTATAGGTGGNITFRTATSGTAVERARIDSSGRLLVGTSSARSIGNVTAGLEIEGTSYSTSSLSITCNASGADTPTINFGRSKGSSVGSSTGGLAAGDDLGYITFSAADGTDLNSRSAWILCQVDGATSGNDVPGRLVFSSTPSGSASPTERMRINNAGEILFGTTSTTNGCKLALANTNATRKWGFGTIGTNTYFAVVDDTTGAGVQLNAGSTSWSTFSDERLKDDLIPIQDGLSKVSRLRAVTGRYKTDDTGTSRSFLIAQDVQAVLPEAVDVMSDDMETLSLKYTEVIPLLVSALKESKERIEALEAKVAVLKAE